MGIERHLQVMDGVANPDAKEITFNDVVAKGVSFLTSAENKDAFEQVWKNIQPDDVANISYTSGTTADPKGIMLTHYNYTINVLQAHTVLEIYSYYVTLATLPWDHSFAHTACLYTFMLKGASVASIQSGKTPLETLRNVPQNIKEIKDKILKNKN